MKRHVLTLVVVSMVAAACSPGEDPAPSPPPDAIPPTPTEVETDNEPANYSATEIPAVEDIDLAYVQWVIADAITPVTDLAIRLQVEAATEGATQVPPEVLELYATVYGEDFLQSTLRETVEPWEGDEWDPGPIRDEPGPVVVEVTEIVDSGPDCLIVTFLRDLSPRVHGVDGPTHLIALLKPKPAEADPAAANPSPWRIVRQFTLDSVRGEPSC